MTNKEKSRYGEPEALKDILYQALNGKRFSLECGHYISLFTSTLGNDLTIRNGKGMNFKVTCAQCGY